MRHIGDVLLKDGKPTGQMKALCGAVCSKLTSGAGPICPQCEALNKRC